MRTIIENGWILTMDAENTSYRNGYVVFEDDRITGTGAVPARKRTESESMPEENWSFPVWSIPTAMSP